MPCEIAAYFAMATDAWGETGAFLPVVALSDLAAVVGLAAAPFGAVGGTGVEGTAGFVGSAGFVDFPGSTGVVGFAGSDGTAGFVGSAGFVDFPGSADVVGFAGCAGTAGFLGSVVGLGTSPFMVITNAGFASVATLAFLASDVDTFGSTDRSFGAGAGGRAEFLT